MSSLAAPRARIVFMGSPAFALPALRALLGAGYQIALVVSQPDRPAGRNRRLRAPAVAAFAREAGLPLYQPEHLRTDPALEPIRQAAPDVVVVAAFGLLLPTRLLELPPAGCLNIHPSLLPRHRGASPIEAAILAGDPETGVTIIQVTEQMDAGPILVQRRTPIGPDEDAPSLEARLADLGARLLVECLEPWLAGRLTPTPQNDAEATYCRRLRREDAELDWTQPAAALHRVVRAFRGRIDAHTFWNDRLLKILSAGLVELPEQVGEPGRVLDGRPFGMPRWPVVATGAGGLLLRELALEGRAPTTGQAFINGYPGFLGAKLGRRGSVP